ncbi:glucosaminidase domain-containing protein [Sphingobacterium deserti]|uniref:Peptidoglycan hydrolase n=1 Tax=Sphingobacterium deserti TaxID=1229276 RepID=A0A0B8T948_9SPHI|nr:glucosaminidase domain-containing protein [Sphingobacterium deserti]KGE14520.1 peptidoglycan-binding lysin domain [Sphingobacterium deserti]
MQKTGISKYVVVLLMFVFTVAKTNAQKFSPSSYIAEHKNIAQQLMTETGVPASVILAIAIHESAYGNSKIAQHLNNHFGIKGKNSSRKIRSAYKGYQSVRESYLDFISFLKRRKSTSDLFDDHGQEDYQKWVRGIGRSGYSTTKTWSSKVLATINRYNLDEFDQVERKKATLAEVKQTKPSDLLLSSMEKNESLTSFTSTQTHVVGTGETLSTVAKRYDTSIELLKKRNNLQSSKLSIGQRLFL